MREIARLPGTIDAGRERFDDWMASRPNLPGLSPVRPPTDETDKSRRHQMYGSFIRREGVTARPAHHPRKNVMEMLDQLETEDKVTMS